MSNMHIEDHGLIGDTQTRRARRRKRGRIGAPGHGATGRVNPCKPPFAVFRAYQSHEISRMAA